MHDHEHRLFPFREHRERRGLSQQEVADRMGCSPQKVSLIELGERPLRVRDLEAYAGAIGERAVIELRGSEGTAADALRELAGALPEDRCRLLVRLAAAMAELDPESVEREVTLLEVRAGIVDLPRPGRRELG